MKTKLFVIAALLVAAAMFTLISCNNTSDVTNDDQNVIVDDNNAEDSPVADAPLNEYDVEDAELSTINSREKLSDKYKELQSLYNLAVDMVAKTEGETKEQVKSIGAEFIDFMDNKIANPDYAKFEAFIQDAIVTLDEIQTRLIAAVPAIAPED
ncbi:MAG: hypothetical protein IJO74_01380 [Clostridia bacterium]|nr:hypothetical protein [Clostridia bacterium]